MNQQIDGASSRRQAHRCDDGGQRTPLFRVAGCLGRGGSWCLGLSSHSSSQQEGYQKHELFMGHGRPQAVRVAAAAAGGAVPRPACRQLGCGLPGAAASRPSLLERRQQPGVRGKLLPRPLNPTERRAPMGLLGCATAVLLKPVGVVQRANWRARLHRSLEPHGHSFEPSQSACGPVPA